MNDQPFLKSIDEDTLAAYPASRYTAELRHAFEVGVHDGEKHLVDPVVKDVEPLADDLLTAYNRGRTLGAARRERRGSVA